MKLRAFCLLMLLIFICAPAETQGQDRRSYGCEEAFYNARDLYYRGQFEGVHSWLSTCLRDFDQNKSYYLENNQELVFKVYKLIITSYYDNDYDYLAENKINELLYFFAGYDQNAVLRRLNNTSF